MSNAIYPSLQMAALQGVTDSGEPFVIIALENPVQLIAGGLPLSKEALERLQLERFRSPSLSSGS
jgi:hypothetical protein